jgi:purine-nucleoside phosphorylase
MQNSLADVSESAGFLKQNGFNKPVVGIVLGSGLGSFLKKIDIIHSLPYQEIPGFPISTVEFHKGQLIFGSLNAVPLVVMQGRFHYYEGYSMQQITFPVRVMKELGIRFLLLSNVAGAMNPLYKKADLALLVDHINQQPENPLRGLNDPAFGNRFVDMYCPYDEVLNRKIREMAKAMNLHIHEAVYVAVAGPNLETKAEYRMLRSMGADIVGMSTVPEVIVANHIGLPCAAVSVITDECDPDNLKPINIADIMENAARADEKLSELFAAVIKDLV